MKKQVTVIGAGLAGCEAAYQLARRGIEVKLFEMKPEKKTPAHSADYFCELVCSNSLRSDDAGSASGLLKAEMRKLGSLVLACADETRVPAGGALAVDREKFGSLVTEKLKAEKNIEITGKEITEIPDGPVIIATGPLTSDALAENIKKYLNIFNHHIDKPLFFFDAVAPVVSSDSIDFSHAFIADRYGKGEGEGDYINCPLNKEEYEAFYDALISAKTAELNDFENDAVFEGCLPIEVLAARGKNTMRFGPLKPVGLFDPAEGRRPYAVVQLRRENLDGTMYNLVGFQTHLLWGEQRRVFSMIPALKNAEFLRYGVMHKNTYIDSPRNLTKHYNMIFRPDVFFAGQITGVEGYIESASSGMLAALNIYNRLTGEQLVDYARTTAITSLACHIAYGDGGRGAFSPMNVNFGLFTPVDDNTLPKGRRGKQERREAMLARAAEDFKNYFSAFLS